MKEFDLSKRTEKLAFDIIDFTRNLKKDFYNFNAIKQIIRSGTSIGANYREAVNASSRKDFRNKLYYCKKETEETLYWLKIIGHANQEQINSINILKKEVNEILKIFQKAISTTNNNLNN